MCQVILHLIFVLFKCVPFLADGSSSSQLLWVEKTLLSYDYCNTQTGNAGDLDSTMMCAGEAGKDACQVTCEMINARVHVLDACILKMLTKFAGYEHAQKMERHNQETIRKRRNQKETLPLQKWRLIMHVNPLFKVQDVFE